MIVGGEFGRTPWVESSGRINVQNGRNHNNKGFTTLLAGGGIAKAAWRTAAPTSSDSKQSRTRCHIHDLHATVLHQMGLDHTQLTYRYSGRDFRLTDVAGNVLKDIIA